MTAAPSPHRILVRAPTWVGDAVMATPALRALRAGFPQARISVEGPPALAGLLAGLESFDEYVEDPGRGVRAVLRRTRSLRARDFELAVLLPDSPRAALAPRLAGIPRRIGYTRDPLRRALLTDRIEHATKRGRRAAVPTIERYLEITRRLACPDCGTQLELVVSADASERVDAELARRRIAPDERLLVVTPGAGFGASKLWPTAHFARACEALARQHGLVPVLAPGPRELATAREIVQRMNEGRSILLEGEPRLADLKAWIARSALLLTNDTGPRHIAVALGRPAVVVMGPTDPTHTALHLERQRVLRNAVACSPCQLKICPIDHRCMTGLAPETVVAAANDLLAR